MRVLRILPPEFGEELSELDLQIGWKGCRQPVSFLELNASLAGGVDLENDVAEALEVRVHVPVEGNLRVRHGEAVDLRIMVAPFDRTDVVRGRPTAIRQCDEADIHVGAGCTWPLRADRTGVGTRRSELLLQLLYQRDRVSSSDAVRTSD